MKISWFNIRPETNTSIPCKWKNKKATKRIDLLQKLQATLPQTSLLTVYMSFIKPHLNYGDVVYDQPSNDAFSNKIETVQLTIAKNYRELELEYLQQKRWIRCLCLFYKVVPTKIPAFLYNFIPPVRQSQRHQNSFNSFSCRTEFFKNSFFPCVTVE